MSKKIALLIPTTSKGRDSWAKIKDTYLYNLSLKTLLLTQSNEHEYVFYIGIDSDDRIFANLLQQAEITKFKTVFKNIDIKFITMENVQKGHLTKMWNILFRQAYNEDCDYFYQCGDDINFRTKGWINDSIETLRQHNDVGLTGPINNNNRILTQAFVSRKHMEIFGWFFPEEIINWCCDDWYNMVYHPTYLYPLQQHFSSNDGGAPRYEINNNKNFAGKMGKNFNINTNKLRDDTNKLAERHKQLIVNYLRKS